ncbi:MULTISPECIES: Fur family transcriptional regulator [unclassified Butyrivibrio]|uniref:Fur family transcriptional regulator n=1 Tax=unclassified Butyrivibrio TaxID=2639466 RepID=UPI0003B5051C|nr:MULTISPECIES: transcriptional repressor [unclassified Butyrivibrio]MDC7292151.1 transcriptional repressor [Butyrivibrio sp. DSM 10294]
MNCKIHHEHYDEIIDKFWPEGFKKTKQRIDIFKILHASETPLSAAEIYNQLLADTSKEQYAFSTIYRTLLAFEKAGIVTKSVLSTEDNAIYELSLGTHKHYAICLSCHKKFPIQACPMHIISEEVNQTLPDFRITGHQLEVYGYCRDCQ